MITSVVNRALPGSRRWADLRSQPSPPFPSKAEGASGVWIFPQHFHLAHAWKAKRLCSKSSSLSIGQSVAMRTISFTDPPPLFSVRTVLIAFSSQISPLAGVEPAKLLGSFTSHNRG